MAKAFLGLGSNIGSRQRHLADAVRLLEENGIKIIKHSSIIESKPVGGPPGQGNYLNAVVQIDTDYPPERLLEIIQTIEKKCGRVRGVKNAARTLDIDILLYENITLITEKLTLPHPRMASRDFVIKPLLEVEPDIFKNNNQVDNSGNCI